MVVHNPSDGVYRGPLTRSPYSGPARSLPNGMPIPTTDFDGFVNPLDPFISRPDPVGGATGAGGRNNGGSGGGGGNGGGGGGNPGPQEVPNPKTRLPKAPAGKPGNYRIRRTPGQSVLDWAKQTLGTWGLDDPAILDAIKNARNENDMLVKIRESDAYKKRFAGNIARAKAGFGMLNEAQYLAQEESYRQAMHAAGLPKGFYDSPDDFAQLMGGDVSVAEVTARADMAGTAMVNKDPEFVKAMKRMYGLTKGELAAYAMDPDRALPLLQRRFDAMELGAEAGRFDIDRGNKRWLNKLVSQGVDQGAARQAFGKVDAIEGDVGRLAGLAGVKQSSDKQLANNELGVGGKKSRRRAKRDNALRSQERARLSGGSGGGGVFGGSTSGF